MRGHAFVDAGNTALLTGAPGVRLQDSVQSFFRGFRVSVVRLLHQSLVCVASSGFMKVATSRIMKVPLAAGAFGACKQTLCYRCIRVEHRSAAGSISTGLLPSQRSKYEQEASRSPLTSAIFSASCRVREWCSPSSRWATWR